MKPGDYPLHSERSRAAARSLLEARKAKESDGLCFVFRSIVDGSVLDLEALANRKTAPSEEKESQ